MMISSILRSFVLMAAIAILGVFGASAAAQENEGLIVKMAVIDIQAILRDAAAVKDIRSQIEKYRGAAEGEIQKEQEEIVNANKELERQRTILSPDSYNEERRKFETRVVSAQRLVQQRKRELNEVLNRAMIQVEKALNEVIADIAREHKFSLLFRKAQTILVTRQLDITHIVLQSLDQKLPTVQVQEPGGVAPKTGN